MLQKRVFTRHKRFLHCLPPRWGGITHISQKKCFVALFLTASPSREKPLVEIFIWFLLIKNVGCGTRLLPSGRSCQPPALRNRGLTDVGHRRRRQRYPIPYCIDLRRNGYILNIFVRIASNFETYTIEYSNRAYFDPSRRDTSIFHSLRWPDFLIPFWVWFYSQSVL